MKKTWISKEEILALVPPTPAERITSEILEAIEDRRKKLNPSVYSKIVSSKKK